MNEGEAFKSLSRLFADLVGDRNMVLIGISKDS